MRAVPQGIADLDNADLKSANLLFTPILCSPVRAGLVEKEEEYLWSSCGTRYGARKGLLNGPNFNLESVLRIPNPTIGVPG